MPPDALLLLHDIRDRLSAITMNVGYFRISGPRTPEENAALNDMESAALSVAAMADAILKMVNLQEKAKEAE